MQVYLVIGNDYNMKKLIIILFLIPVICNAQLAKDKEAHLAFGTFFGVAGNGKFGNLQE